MRIKLPSIWLVSTTLFGICYMPIETHAENTKTETDLYSLSLKELLKIKVSSASKQEQAIADAPSIINVITAHEIAQLGASNLMDVLSIIPGFTPLRQLKSDRIMVVRGLALNDGILVLIDGVPVNDAFDGGFNFYERTLDDIQRVEVIRGPGSALYGGYAVSAVIHIFTTKPNTNSQDYKVTLSSGSFNEKKMAFSANKDFSNLVDGLSMAASFSYFDNDGDKLTIKQDSIFRPTQAEFLAPLVNPTLTPTQRQESVEKFNGHSNIQYKDLNINFGHSQIIATPLVSHLGIVTEVDRTIKESTQDRLSAHYQWESSDKLNIKSKIYWVNNESKLFGQSQPPQIHGDEDQDGLNEDFTSGIIENFQHRTESIGLEVEFNYQSTDTHNLLLGLAYDNTELKDSLKFANVSLLSRGPSAVFPARDLTSEFVPSGLMRELSALYLQDSWQINNNAKLTTGLRYGDYSDFGNTLNPRVGLTYQISDLLYSKLLYGEAFKPPAFSQLFDNTPTLSASRIRGNIDLQPTEITTFEAQLGYDISSYLQASLTIFENDTDNEIFFNPAPGIEKWLNSGQRRSHGLEFELRGEMLGLDYAFLNYSYQDTHGADIGAGANIHSPHRFNLGGSYQFSDKNSAGFTVSYFSSPDRENNDTRSPVDEKTIINFVFQSKEVWVNGLSFKLTIDNLLDQDGKDEVEAAVGLLEDIPIEGRNLRLGLTYEF